MSTRIAPTRLRARDAITRSGAAPARNPRAAELVARVQDAASDHANARDVERLCAAVALAAEALDDPVPSKDFARARIPALRAVGLKPAHLRELAHDLAGLVASLAADGTPAPDDDEWTRAVSCVVDAVRATQARHEDIADLTEVVDEIAFRTELLALNTAVRAAHAGAPGQDFAAFACEVRALARRSAEAAQEIARLNAALSERTAS